MSEIDKVIWWFTELTKHDKPRAGGKGANLGELTQAGIPVPPGYVVSAGAYAQFIEEARLGPSIRAALEGLDPNDNEKLELAANTIKELILEAVMPSPIEHAIRGAYREMGAPLVAVRSSATAEDLAEASFAGQQSTYLNILGEDMVVDAVKACWASLFEARAIFYRVHQGFDHLSVNIAVPVQKMVQSEVSGVMFTAEPVSADRNTIAIEAIFGLGEAIVGGAVTPDLYMLNKKDLKLNSKQINFQDWKLVRNVDGVTRDTANVEIHLAPGEGDLQKLSDEQIAELAGIGRAIEELYGTPQDIEWAGEDGKLYIVQARPITTLDSQASAAMVATAKKAAIEITAQLLLTGGPASPGANWGPVKVIFSPSQVGEVNPGDVLVAPMTTPDYVPAMKRAAAIITDQGGRTCHAAIVSRELGIPCVVGTQTATKSLRNLQIVTVDGSTGKVWEGEVVALKEASDAPKKPVRKYKTTTKLYVNLAEVDLAETVAARNVDGIGLLRAEFMIARIKKHPKLFLEEGKGAEFTERLATDLERFAKAFSPRPIVYRLTDFKTDEYKGLEGGARFEGEEENPMLGYRGASRYITDIDVFRLEVEAVKQVRRKYKNLWVMVPFVRTVDELSRTKKLLSKLGLRQNDKFKLWMMAEIPSNVFLLDQFLDVGIDGVSIGSNDLTQLILGVDRDNQRLADTFDERNPAVMMALEHIIRTCKERGVTVSICGQAPSVYPDLTQKLVEWGITSVSVSPDMIDETRAIIARAERRVKKEQEHAEQGAVAAAVALTERQPAGLGLRSANGKTRPQPLS
ncbi:MAG: phosphoenolpyruvate synthase [Chloroflexi bacterium]|nr:phosphoenolpyruvate synthase [Chloroflexota bacterium]